MPQTLLALFAHPDDEAFGTGGALSQYAAGRRGRDAGQHDPRGGR